MEEHVVGPGEQDRELLRALVERSRRDPGTHGALKAAMRALVGRWFRDRRDGGLWEVAEPEGWLGEPATIKGEPTGRIGTRVSLDLDPETLRGYLENAEWLS